MTSPLPILATCMAGADAEALQEVARAIEVAERQLGPIHRERLEHFLASKLSDLPEDARGAHLLKLRIDALCVAFAAAEGNPAGVVEIEHMVHMGCATWIRSTGSDPGDVSQTVLAKLLTSEAGSPKRILEYRGVAPLQSFLRIVCTRLAISMARKTLAESHLSLSYEVAAPGADFEIQALRARYREPFAEAMREAMATLSPKSKTLLMLHFNKGVQVAALATMYNVHRVSMSRWIADAKAELFESTRDRFKARVQVTDSEYQSVMAALRSEVDVRLSTLVDHVPI